jgi:hypothetical protein
MTGLYDDNILMRDKAAASNTGGGCFTDRQLVAPWHTSLLHAPAVITRLSESHSSRARGQIFTVNNNGTPRGAVTGLSRPD